MCRVRRVSSGARTFRRCFLAFRSANLSFRRCFPACLYGTTHDCMNKRSDVLDEARVPEIVFGDCILGYCILGPWAWTLEVPDDVDAHSARSRGQRKYARVCLRSKVCIYIYIYI